MRWIKQAYRCRYPFQISKRKYATVDSNFATIITRPPRPPPIPLAFNQASQSILDARILDSLAGALHESPQVPLTQLIDQYQSRSGHILDHSLPYESAPTIRRKVDFDAGPSGSGTRMVAHCIKGKGGHKITLSSGFALESPDGGPQLVLTCAHTLEEIRRSPLLSDGSVALTSSGSFLIGEDLSGNTTLEPVSAIHSSLHRSDLILLSGTTSERTNSLPISPYPVQPNTRIRIHLVTENEPLSKSREGWTPWVGGWWSKWHKGCVLGYRDFSGRESEPGTYDALSHMLFEPLPTPGSSGGPIVDEETGSVVGVMLGTRMDNRVEGNREWGVPSEAIFEMFTLPGLRGKY